MFVVAFFGVKNLRIIFLQFLCKRSLYNMISPMDPKYEYIYIKFGEILFSRYQTETKFWRKSRAITLVQICEKMIRHTPRPDLVIMNAYIKFGEILSICSQDIEQKRNYDGQNDGQPKSNIAPTFQSQAIII